MMAELTPNSRTHYNQGIENFLQWTHEWGNETGVDMRPLKANPNHKPGEPESPMIIEPVGGLLGSRIGTTLDEIEERQKDEDGSYSNELPGTGGGGPHPPDPVKLEPPEMNNEKFFVSPEIPERTTQPEWPAFVPGNPVFPETGITGPIDILKTSHGEHLEQIVGEMGEEAVKLRKQHSSFPPSNTKHPAKAGQMWTIEEKLFNRSFPGSSAGVANQPTLGGKIPSYGIRIRKGIGAGAIANEYVHSIYRGKGTLKGLQQAIDNLEKKIYGRNLPNWELHGAKSMNAATKFRTEAYKGQKMPLMEHYHMQNYWKPYFETFSGALKSQGGHPWIKEIEQGTWALPGRTINHMLEERLSHLSNIRYNQLSGNPGVQRSDLLRYWGKLEQDKTKYLK